MTRKEIIEKVKDASGVVIKDALRGLLIDIDTYNLTKNQIITYLKRLFKDSLTFGIYELSEIQVLKIKDILEREIGLKIKGYNYERN